MNLIKNYMNNETLRHELNILTQKTFGFDFESWVTNGFFEGDYIPYSFESDGRILANASANLMHFIQNGQEKTYIQIGTVMTAKDYRNKGYASELINEIRKDYNEKCDGIYLFGDIDALKFYHKLGFTQGMQYRCTLKKEFLSSLQHTALQRNKEICFQSIDYSNHLLKEKYVDYVRDGAVNSAFEQKNKFGLQMFYTPKLENVYYCTKLDCFIVISKRKQTLFLKSIICSKHISLEELLSFLQAEYEQLILGFSPCKEQLSLFDIQEYDGANDYRFFYQGESLASIESEQLFFPELSHA